MKFFDKVEKAYIECRFYLEDEKRAEINDHLVTLGDIRSKVQLQLLDQISQKGSPMRLVDFMKLWEDYHVPVLEFYGLLLISLTTEISVLDTKTGETWKMEGPAPNYHLTPVPYQDPAE